MATRKKTVKRLGPQAAPLLSKHVNVEAQRNGLPSTLYVTKLEDSDGRFDGYASEIDVAENEPHGEVVGVYHLVGLRRVNKRNALIDISEGRS